MAAQPPVVGPLAPVANPAAEVLLPDRAGPVQTVAEVTEQDVLDAQEDCRGRQDLLRMSKVTPKEALDAKLRFNTVEGLWGKQVYPQASEGIADVQLAVQPFFQGLGQQLQQVQQSQGVQQGQLQQVQQSQGAQEGQLQQVQQSQGVQQGQLQQVQQSQGAQQGQLQQLQQSQGAQQDHLQQLQQSQEVTQQQLQVNTEILNVLTNSIQELGAKVQDLGAKFTAQSQFDKRCRQNALTHAAGHGAIQAPPKVIPGLGLPLPRNLNGALEPQQLAELGVGDVPQSCPLSFAALGEFTRAEINLLSMEYNDQMGITGDDGIVSRRDKARRFLCGL